MAVSISPARKGTPWTLVTGLGVHQVLGPQQPAELAEVHLGHQHLSVAGRAPRPGSGGTG